VIGTGDAPLKMTFGMKKMFILKIEFVKTKGHR